MVGDTVINNEVYRSLVRDYPNMATVLQELLQDHDFSVVDCGLERDLHVFGGRFTGDGKLYDQRDSLLRVDGKRVGRLREISQRGNLVFSQLQIDDGDNVLAANGSGFYVQYDFERQKREDDNPAFPFP